jgi:uncharacterized membrane protein YjjP (DUF1212 family)
MRHLRKKRLFFFVSAPWFCLKFALNWQQTIIHYPVLRTGDRLRLYVQGLFITSVFLAFVFSIAVSLAGRQFAVSRFFLSPSESPSDELGAGALDDATG